MLMLAAGQQLSTGRHVALVIAGIVLGLLGVGLAGAGFSRRAMEWNNTHNRSFQRVPHYGRLQSAYNTWVMRLVGLLCLAGGVAATGVGLGLIPNS